MQTCSTVTTITLLPAAGKGIVGEKNHQAVNSKYIKFADSLQNAQVGLSNNLYDDIAITFNIMTQVARGEKGN